MLVVEALLSYTMHKLIMFAGGFVWGDKDQFRNIHLTSWYK